MFRKLSLLITCVAKSPKTTIPAFVSRNYSIYEPDYLDLLKPKYPIYETINIQVKGYDYAVLENYQKFLHRIAEAMELEIADGWATPPQHYQIQRFKPASSVIETEYKLTMYDRTIQLSDVPSPTYPLLLRVAQSALPEGVTLNVVEHSEDDEEIRYVPDRELLELKVQLDDMGGPMTKKR